MVETQWRSSPPVLASTPRVDDGGACRVSGKLTREEGPQPIRYGEWQPAPDRGCHFEDRLIGSRRSAAARYRPRRPGQRNVHPAPLLLELVRRCAGRRTPEIEFRESALDRC